MNNGSFEDSPDKGGSKPEFVSGDNLYQPQLFRSVLERSTDKSVKLGQDDSLEFESFFPQADKNTEKLEPKSRPNLSAVHQEELTEGLQINTFQNKEVDQGKFTAAAEVLGINQQFAQSKFKELNSTTLSADLAARTLTDMTFACWKRGITPW
ncbi:MAG: hypothetical protein IPK73_20970 [Candidatus Obscuribacter sp.]|nr:hypothetical protein [Candidatus Obscuribacter sp.]MBK9276590.1 hypothetical protein [Candidatus Obscuribacter sp.]